MPKSILFLAKLRGEKSFLEGASIDLSSKLSLTCEGNVNHREGVHDPLSTLPVGIENTLVIFLNKSVSSSLKLVSRYVFFLAKLKRRGKPIFGGGKKKGGGCIVRLHSKALGCYQT